jgi:hypothetical protein
VIVAAAVAIALGLLAADAYLIDHLPLDLPHVLAEQVATALVTVIFLTELGRIHARRERGEGQ